MYMSLIASMNPKDTILLEKLASHIEEQKKIGFA
jgi:hypothetical protein